MTVGELLSRASSRELTEWMEYDRLEAERRPPVAVTPGRVRADNVLPDVMVGDAAATLRKVWPSKGKPPRA